MIGFDSPEAQAAAFEQARAAFAAMQPVLEQFQEAVQQVWAAITQIVRRFLVEFNRFWDALPVSVRAQFRARSQTIMRRKIRRYAFAYARRQ
jgi:hypothetical protein